MKTANSYPCEQVHDRSFKQHYPFNRVKKTREQLPGMQGIPFYITRLNGNGRRLWNSEAWIVSIDTHNIIS
jgi:hypothetical protein